MEAVDPYLIITEPTFVARLLLDPDADTEESVANADAFVDLSDGTSSALTIFTVDEVRRLLSTWKTTGEVGNGSYLSAAVRSPAPDPLRAVELKPPGDRQRRRPHGYRARSAADELIPLHAASWMTTMRFMEFSHTDRLDSATSRRAGPEDARAVAEVIIRSRRAAVGAIPAAVHSDTEVREWINNVVLPEREVWLTEGSDGRALAVLILHGDWVDQLYVEPAMTGRGLGSRLIELAKSRRPAGLQLWTFVTNTRAQKFYLRHGFAVAETTDGSGNEEKAPDIRFVWTGR